MKQIARELGGLLVGEVTIDKQTRQHFSTDGSIFSVDPGIVIYPKSERDVVLTVRYFGEKAQSGNKVGITARGKGTDRGGAALGEGAMLVFPAHMSRLVDLNKYTVTVQPGMIYANLQTLLQSHGRFLPPYPASLNYSTIGGAVANNASGEKSVKYGATRDYVESLRVVLSNGNVIQTARLGKRELTKKKQQDDFEGHIYRALDNLIEQHRDIINAAAPAVSKNTAGYALWDVKHRDGSFDLSQLIVGSQGTLGIVTEATLRHEAWQPESILLVGFFDSIEKSAAAIKAILHLSPSAVEVVDYHLLDYLQKTKPEQIAGLVPDRLPKVAVVVEFDDVKARWRQKKAKSVAKIFKRYSYDSRYAADAEEQDALWKICRGGPALVWMNSGVKKALPVIEDGIVPIERMGEFLVGVYDLFGKYKLEVALWGHGGDANFHLQPMMNLASAKDRNRVFDLARDFYRLVIKLGGSTSGQHNDGILRAPYLKKMYGPQVYHLLEEVKQIFDPLGILNPNVKLGVSEEYAAAKLRHDYSMAHLHDYLPGHS